MTELTLPGRHRFTPFPVGAKGVGIEILASNAQPWRSMTKTIYAVRYDCCGKESTLTHHAIAYRLRQGTQKCRGCNSKAMRESYFKHRQDMTMTITKKERVSPAHIKEEALKIASSAAWK